MFKAEAFPEVAFENENASIFAEYWASLPKVDLIPMRASFDPADVRGILSSFEIHEMIGPGHIRVRLAGTSVTDRYGFEITGRNYLDIVHPSRREKVWRALSHIVNHPCAMIVYIRSVRASGLEVVSEAVGFPFRDEEGRANQVIYQDNARPPVEYWDYRVDDRKASRALRRTYIDIGGGVPDWDPAEDDE